MTRTWVSATIIAIKGLESRFRTASELTDRQPDARPLLVMRSVPLEYERALAAGVGIEKKMETFYSGLAVAV